MSVSFEFPQHERSSFSPLLPEFDVVTMFYFSHYDRCGVVQSLSRVQLFVTPWTAARQDSPSLRVCSNSFPLSQWCHPTVSSSIAPFSSCLQSFPASGSFPRLGSSQQVAKVLNFSFCISSSSEYSGLISFRIDWFDLLSVQRTLRSLLYHQFFGIQPSLGSNSHIHSWLLEHHSFDYTDLCNILLWINLDVSGCWCLRSWHVFICYLHMNCLPLQLYFHCDFHYIFVLLLKYFWSEFLIDSIVESLKKSNMTVWLLITLDHVNLI